MVGNGSEAELERGRVRLKTRDEVREVGVAVIHFTENQNQTPRGKVKCERCKGHTRLVAENFL